MNKLKTIGLILSCILFFNCQKANYRVTPTIKLLLPSAISSNITGDDLSHTVKVFATNAFGKDVELFKVTFGAKLGYVPKVFWCPKNSSAANVLVYCRATSEGYSFFSARDNDVYYGAGEYDVIVTK